MKIAALFVVCGLFAPSAFAQAHCTADIDGYKIHTVYVMGTSYKAVAWAYKHLSDESCLTPVTSMDKADAILELVLPEGAHPTSSPESALSVTCNSSAGDTQCLDSDGNEMDVSCDSAGNCSSYYGPSLIHAVGGLVTTMIESSVGAAEARIYTLDHKLVWKSELIKAKFPYTQWNDKIHMPPLAPACKMPNGWQAHDFKNFRHWASERCAIVFDPPISIDLKANRRTAEKTAKQDELEEMRHNAQNAAAKQQEQKQPPQ
jgi:hypothetical protein